MKEDELLETLKAILLEDDRLVDKHIRSELEKIRDELLDDEKFGSRMRIHRDADVAFLKENFAQFFGNDVTTAIKHQIKNSQDEVIEALYPIIGKLISRFIRSEFEKLREGIDQQMSEVVSTKKWKRKFRSWISGTKESDLLISEQHPPSIEEILIIQKDSGLLLGSYSRNETVDQDMIAGMLTAIKAFVEDAFQKDNQDLEEIDYSSYRLLIFNFHKYYLTISVSGIIDTAFREKLSNKTFDFAEKHMNKNIIEVNSDLVSEISEKLSQTYND
ncbi:MAG: cell envelope biogenesis protein OmpA [Chitinophagales bacterium]|nr:cell envelope biogenesis protein OmpA [Chitinophagales bacterium]